MSPSNPNVPISHCTICGGSTFVQHAVLWPELVNDWQLSPEEQRYIDRQQGLLCASCGCNLRSMALGNAICTAYGFAGTLVEFCATPTAHSLAVLEINEAGQLTGFLNRLPGHRLVAFPAYDMTDLGLPGAEFDLVVHSDTLEHIPNAVRGLAECRRVLRPDGHCIFTVPIVVGRLSRSRNGMKPSFHGAPTDGKSDLLVHHEFGADAWTLAIKAGFRRAALHVLEYPAGIAIEACLQ